MLKRENHIDTKDKKKILLDECLSWLQQLTILKEDSNMLKTKLSEELDKTVDTQFLGQAEHFQNLIILRDEFIRDIIIDIRLYEKSLREPALDKKTTDEKWMKKHQRLKNELYRLANDFILIKKDFNKALLRKVK